MKQKINEDIKKPKCKWFNDVGEPQFIDNLLEQQHNNKLKNDFTYKHECLITKNYYEYMNEYMSLYGDYKSYCNKEIQTKYYNKRNELMQNCLETEYGIINDLVIDQIVNDKCNGNDVSNYINQNIER
jgi:hypothetical protein